MAYGKGEDFRTRKDLEVMWDRAQVLVERMKRIRAAVDKCHLFSDVEKRRQEHEEAVQEIHAILEENGF